MIVLRTPKGWSGPKEIGGHKVEGSWRSHQVPFSDVREGFVGMEAPVAAAEQIALEPAHESVLGKHFHHPAVARQLTAVRILR